MRLRCGDELFEVALRRAKDGWRAEVNGAPFSVSLEAKGAGHVVVRHGGETATLHYVREGATLHVFWEGTAYRLIEERGRRASAGAVRAHAESALEAPMPGRVAAVRVEPGQRVAKGDELLVVEAMKMENALRAPRDGVVRAVHARAGEMVAPGRALVELDEAGSAEPTGGARSGGAR